MWKNLTALGRIIVVLIVSAVLLGAAYVFTNGQKAAESPESAPVMRSRPAPQPPATIRQEDEPLAKPAVSAEAPKPSSDPIVTTVTQEQPRVKAKDSYDPWADLKIDKKGQ